MIDKNSSWQDNPPNIDKIKNILQEAGRLEKEGIAHLVTKQRK